MPNYPGKDNSIVFLTADDLVELMTSPIDLERPVSDIRLTEDSGKLLGELTEHQKDKHTGKWD